MHFRLIQKKLKNRKKIKECEIRRSKDGTGITVEEFVWASLENNIK